MSGGSQQQRIYRRARRDGVPVTDAEAMAGLVAGEGTMIDAEDALYPPPPNAYALLGLAAVLVDLCSAWGRPEIA